MKALYQRISNLHAFLPQSTPLEYFLFYFPNATITFFAVNETIYIHLMYAFVIFMFGFFSSYVGYHFIAVRKNYLHTLPVSSKQYIASSLFFIIKCLVFFTISFLVIYGGIRLWFIFIKDEPTHGVLNPNNLVISLNYGVLLLGINIITYGTRQKLKRVFTVLIGYILSIFYVVIENKIYSEHNDIRLHVISLLFGIVLCVIGFIISYYRIKPKTTNKKI